MIHIPPIELLAILIAFTALAGLVEWLLRRRHKRALRRLAAQWKMTYSSRDQLRVARKVADHVPIAGAADVHVKDLIYGSRGEQYCHVFTIEYTLGVVSGKRRRIRAAALTEPRESQSHYQFRVTFGSESQPLLEQYRALAPAD